MEAVFCDFGQQGIVADLKQDCCSIPIPARLEQNHVNPFLLSRFARFATDFLQIKIVPSIHSYHLFSRIRHCASD
jgi:hypothetical protein